MVRHLYPVFIPSHRGLIGFLIALLVFGAASGAHAGAVGTNFPAGGPYSEVNQTGWGTASWPLGATFVGGEGGTLEVGVYSANATAMLLEIYTSDFGASAAYDYWMVKGSDNVWRAAVAQVPGLTLYAFRAWGPNWPFTGSWARGDSEAGYLSDCDGNGNRFNPNKVLYDPYALEISHDPDNPTLTASGNSDQIFASGGADVASGQTYSGPITGNVTMDNRAVDSGPYAPKSVALVDTTSYGSHPDLPEGSAMIYETHLKGLTAHPSSVNLKTLLSAYSGFADAADVPAALAGTYAGAAYMAGYLKDLGINTVEFLPLMETDNQIDVTNQSGDNYWGYDTYGYFSPDRHYAYNQALGGPTKEFKQMVQAFHNAGLQVYLDAVYNHTAEGGVWDGATGMEAQIVSFRGLDNAGYYTLDPGTANQYWDTTGLGQNFNGGSAPVENLVLASLAYWVNTMGVDGFRFDEAVELGRDGASNFSGTSALLTNIAALAASDGFKIIAEPWDTSSEEIGAFPAGWACWNGNYRDTLRQYITGNLSGAGGIGYADAFNGDYNQINGEGGPQKSVNYAISHDGFTMTDQVSYDGNTNAVLTWPFGPSGGGSTSDLSYDWGQNQALRRQAIRSFWSFEVLSRGVPMIDWGDEFGHTLDGNNNSYDIDSVATWNNYNMIASASPDTVATGDTSGGTATYNNDLGTFAGGNNGNFAFLQYLLHLRAAHPAFNQENYNEAFTFSNPGLTGTFSEGSDAAASILVNGTQVGDDDFLVLSNMASSDTTFTLPTPPSGTQWVRLIDTGSWAENVNNCWPLASGSVVAAGGSYGVDNNAIAVFQATTPVPTPSPSPSSSPTPTSTAIASVTPSPTASGTATGTPLRTPSPSGTISQTSTVTPSATSTPSVTLSVTISTTSTVTPTQTSSPSGTASATISTTWTGTGTPQPSPSSTQSPTASAIGTDSPTATTSPSATGTPTPTSTATQSQPTPTPGESAVATGTVTATVLPKGTETSTPTSGFTSAPSPSAGSGPMRIVGLEAMPQPVSSAYPAWLKIEMEGAASRQLEVRLFTKAFVLAAQQAFPGSPLGWGSLPLSPLLRGLPSGLYFAQVRATGDGGAQSSAAARILLLR